ncbi:MAG: MogA/MoaB family molybdenum cofactor biosynthesis protein [Candidatus Dormibacteria bacterium]
MQVVVITVSDRVTAGTATDTSGPAVADLLRRHGLSAGPVRVVPDEPDQIRAALAMAAGEAALVLTTGGTGLGARDHTPGVTAAMADYLVPGLAEEMRRSGREKTPMAILSRGVAAVVGRTLVINLPGSRAGAVESLEAVLPVIPHALDQLAGGDH